MAAPGSVKAHGPCEPHQRCHIILKLYSIRPICPTLPHEELTLRDLRKAHKMSQEKLAAALGVTQVSVSNFEKRSNMRLSTLREYIEALGGELQLRATFPGCPSVTIKTFSDVGSEA